MTIDTNIPAQVAPAQANTKSAKAPKGRVLEDKTQPKVADVLQPLAEDATASRETIVDADKKIVTSHYSFKLSDKDTARYQKVTEFDFSQCSMGEILELATATVRITTQRNLRTLGKGALNRSAYAKVNVKTDIIDATPKRDTADDTTKAVRALMAVANISHEAALKMVEDAAKLNQTAKK